MPSLQDHIAKASHNETFITQLGQLPTQFPDWAMIATFYAALHYVDAVLSLRNLHPPTHHQRSSYVARMRPLRSIYPDYRTLEDTSRDARYTNNPVSPTSVTSNLQHFNLIKEHVRPLLPAGTV